MHYRNIMTLVTRMAAMNTLIIEKECRSEFRSYVTVGVLSV
jgi:hypothetical protein